MSTELNKMQIDLIDKIAKENGFMEYQVTTNKGSEKGDNFLGILTLITLDNGENKLELILKSAQQKDTFRKVAPIRRAYLREIYLYENVFVVFKKYQDDHNIADTFDCYAKIYESSTVEENECLILENLKVKGYQLWNRKIYMNTEHISAVLKEYGKFHAISMAMRHKNVELYEKLTEDIKVGIWLEKDETWDARVKYIKSVMVVGHEAVKDSTDLKEFLKKVEDSLPDLIHKELRTPEYQQALVHGDCWCNNIMFKYENELDKTKPSSLRIVDWQISSENSPAFDFCYFFLIHSTKEVLDDYQSYMKLYYESFSQHLKSFDCDPNEVFPYARFEKHVNRYMLYGMFISFVIMRIMICDSDEAPDFSQLAEGEAFLDSLHFKIKNTNLLNERLRTVIVFIKEHNFFTY
ncbi:unnamed protein product [Psylliodes chrysocephalus]|uniref:CHK kinase-like domain-containing protein n=1 Tax=Psylliodes chrysocephalus TaxID=3402493 RepID=A0A9P0CKS8_9CUCU|nr:unnamed protein product [Psylliodes chrysocephala]